MKRILFVCTGNTCRSPMAAALLRHLGDRIFEVQSAGIVARGKQDASVYAKQVLQQHGVAIHHSSQQVQEEVIQWADSVITMTEQHKQVLIYHFPHVEKKVCTLYEYVGEGPANISDPFGGTEEIYRNTYEELRRLIEKMIEV